jgi:PAS domain S-box-containing protein
MFFIKTIVESFPFSIKQDLSSAAIPCYNQMVLAKQQATEARMFFRPRDLTIVSQIILLAAFCCLANIAPAQHLQIQTYQEWNGLPSNTVYDAAQDSLGRMWFSTRAGLVTFDGQNWDLQTFHPNASAQAQAKLMTDSHGSFWTVAARLPLRLSHLEDGKWTTRNFQGYSFPHFHIVGLEVFNRADGTYRVSIATRNGEIIVWDGTRWILHKATLQVGSIQAMELVGSLVYFATTNGLFQLDIDQLSHQIQPVPGLPSGPVTHITEIPGTDSIWLVGNDWLGHWNGSGLSYLVDKLNLIPPKLDRGTTALADNAGGLYFGGHSTIHYFHPDLGLETLTIENGLIASGATSIFRDREGNTWISSTRGLSKLISRRFAGYNQDSGLLEDEVSAILQLENGKLVFGHEGGLTILGESMETIRFQDINTPTSRVMDLIEDENGDLLIAADLRGLCRLSPQGVLTWIPGSNGFEGGVFTLHRDQGDTLWVGAAKGLFREGKTGFEKITLPSGETKRTPFVRRIVAGPDEDFYIATAHLGVYHYQTGKFTQYLPREGLQGSNAYTCFPRADGALWVGSASGLFKVENGQLVRTSEPEPVIDRPIYSMLEDNSGRIWFGTDLGVMRWDGIHLDHLNFHDGLLGNETNRAALIQDDRGDIWIGTDSGASKFRNVFDLKNSNAPNLQITGFRVDGHEYPADRDLVLPTPPHTLEVLYKGYSFVDENRLHYRSRLLNFEDQWHNTSTSGSGALNYINVPPGKYRFQVQAIRIDGACSPVVTAPWVTIKPPFFGRWYIILTCVCIGIGFLWIIFALLAGRRYTRKLEEESYQQTWDLRLSEQSIKSETRRLAATLENISDGVLAADLGGNIVVANAAAEKILGLSQSDIIGSPLNLVLCLDSEESGAFVTRIPHPRNKNHILEISTSQISDPDHADSSMGHGRVVAFRDITDRLHQEEERIHSQKLESLGVFAGGLAHDFNNLLTVMLGNLSVLEGSTHIPEAEMQMLGLVRDASVRAQNLTRQLLTFARGGTPLLEIASIKNIVRQSVEFSLSGTNVSVQMDLPENLWPVEVDPGQMDQVIANLVLNAVQAMPQGGVIKVSGHNVGSIEHKMVMIEISDEGTGIPEADLFRIFDPYFTTKDMGSGLGLAISYSIINRHGGHITVDSQLGKGSVFRVFLKAC